MESNVAPRRRVKDYDEKKRSEIARFYREFPDRRTAKMYRRFLRYLDGVFRAPGMRYKWQKPLLRSFAKTTKYSLTHIEDTFPAFKRWCTAYTFSYERVGRSNCAKITRNFGVLGNVTGAEIHARLEGAIRRNVALSGRCHCGIDFLIKFCERTRLPFEGVKAVWANLRRLDGLRCRWRGLGRGRKFVAHGEAAKKLQGETASRFEGSPPPSRPVISSYFVGEEKKTAGAAAPGAQADSALAPLASGKVGEGSAAGCAVPGPLGSHAGSTYRPGSTDGGDDPQNRAFRSGESPPAVRPFAGRRPLQICNRWISPRKLDGLARWIAFGCLKPVHREFPRVEFRVPHALNFAREAVELGYPAAAIVQAWRRGVEISHEDALDRDRLPGGGYASTRPPSAAKVYAIGELLKSDALTWEQRWAALVQRPRTGPETRVRRAKGVPGVGDGARGVPDRAPTTAAPSQAPREYPRADSGAAAELPRLSAKEAAEKLAELRAQVAAVQRKPDARPADDVAEGAAPAITAGDVAAYLKTRGMTVANFAALPWRERTRILGQARAWKARGVDKP